MLWQSIALFTLTLLPIPQPASVHLFVSLCFMALQNLKIQKAN